MSESTLSVHPNSSSGAEYSVINLDDSAHMVMVFTPRGRGTFREQAQEVLSTMDVVLKKQLQPMVVTVQTVFLRDPRDRMNCEQILAAHYGSRLPVSNFVLQPPCCGAAIAMEAWAIDGNSVRVDCFSTQALAVSYNHVRWIHCAGITPAGPASGVYTQILDMLKQMRATLDQAGSGFEHVIRTWFYLGGITKPEADTQCYKEMNRARTDFYRDICFCSSLPKRGIAHRIYPSSTAIGMIGTGLVASCLALQTQRKDVFILPLENPLQTPAYDYQPMYSFQTPKFSRAIALVLDGHVTTWISGTASIVNSESRHLNDVEKQTEQTIDNIERLISPENFCTHGAHGAGASLHNLAKIRVYLKRQEDFAKCKAICEHRFGSVPAIYAIADICRQELLVEIEGVAFSRYSPKNAYPHVS